jgi:hypothetical protein
VPRSRRGIAAPMFFLVALVTIAVGCVNTSSDPAPSPLDPSATVPNETLVPREATLPPRDQLPTATAQALLADVSGTIGVQLPTSASECVTGAILDSIPEEELVRFGPSGVLADATQAFQTEVFGSFDDCVDGDALALAGSPVLIAAGASDAQATCFFRLIRNELGMGGFYRYSAAREGDFELDNRLVLVMASVTQRCGIDTSTLVVITTTTPPPPTDPPEPGAPSTSTTVAASTTTDPNAPSTTRQVVTVVTNAPRVTLSTTTTAPLPPVSAPAG